MTSMHPRSRFRCESLEGWIEADGAVRRQELESLRERIPIMDRAIRAWAVVAPQPASGEGALAGIPFGVKDIIETAGLPTEYGSPLYQGRTGTADAAIVRQFRELGAVVMGKTHTAAFAYRTPAVTRNPRNPEHTPGGSSSGSAAAVAAGMIPMAVGTQTLGSVVRPASYCGVTGFKPSFGLFSREGVLPMAKSLDTLGFFTETPADMLRLWEALGMRGGDDADVTFGVPEPLPAVEAAMAQAFRAAVAGLRSRGIRIEPVPIANRIERLAEETRLIMFYEGAHAHEARYREYGDRLLDLAALVREGLALAEGRYQEARAFVAESAGEIGKCFAETPVLLTPAATGPAPKGLSSTGDPRMNSAWTALGTPAISIPMRVTGSLPLGMQLTAAPGQDALVLRAAVRLHAHGSVEGGVR